MEIITVKGEEYIKKSDLKAQIDIWGRQNYDIGQKAVYEEDKETEEHTRSVAIFIVGYLHPLLDKNQILSMLE